jgi:hypothetical protein
MDFRLERRLLAAWGGAALGVATSVGCVDTPVTSATHRPTDSRDFAQRAMSTGPMLVKIQGDPYAAPEGQIEEAVLDAMRQAMRWTPTPRLTTDPAVAKIPSMIVVMTFNGGDVDANAQCAGESRGGEPRPQGAVQVTASFCGSDTPLSNTSGHIKDTTGAGDPQFAALISRVTHDLFPENWQQYPGTGIQIGGGSGGFGIGTGLGIGIGWW